MNSRFIINLLLLRLLGSRPEEERGSLVEHGTLPKIADLLLSKRRPRSHLLTTGIKIQYHSRISDLSILASGLCLGRHTKRDLGTITLSLAIQSNMNPIPSASLNYSGLRANTTMKPWIDSVHSARVENWLQMLITRKAR